MNRRQIASTPYRHTILKLALICLTSFFAVSAMGSGDQTAKTEQVDPHQIYIALADSGAKEAFLRLPIQVQAEVWQVHLQRALLEVPSLSPEERSVLLEGLGLLASPFFLHDPSSLEFRVETKPALEHLEQRFRDVFASRPVGRAIFAELGASVRLTGEPYFHPPSSRRGIDCGCSQESDFCDWVTNPDSECKAYCCPECIGTQSGCGFFFLHSCDGICN